MRIILLILMILVIARLQAQEEKGIYAGASFGGPIPLKSIPGATGEPGLHPNVGLYHQFLLNNKFFLESTLTYTIRSARYTQDYRKDTLVPVNIFGTIQYVPTWYNAHVQGRLRLNYFDAAILLGVRVTERTKILVGPIGSFVISGKDQGNVLIRVGEGGFFDDFYEYFNNYHNINKAEIGIAAQANQDLSGRLGLGVRVSRSFLPLYKTNTFANRGLEEVKLYNTFVYAFLKFRLW